MTFKTLRNLFAVSAMYTASQFTNAATVSGLDGANDSKIVAVDNNEFLRGPVVKSSKNVVYINDKSVPNEYFGNLFIGSEVWRATVSYDTISDWTVVSNEFDL